jgi:hypothetical protein
MWVAGCDTSILGPQHIAQVQTSCSMRLLGRFSLRTNASEGLAAET